MFFRIVSLSLSTGVHSKGLVENPSRELGIGGQGGSST